MEKNKNNPIVLRKIELKVFIDTLVEIYNTGADYVDIVGNPDERQDTIALVVHQEYMSEDAEDHDMEMTDDEDDDTSNPLSDKDLNELL